MTVLRSEKVHGFRSIGQTFLVSVPFQDSIDWYFKKKPSSWFGGFRSLFIIFISDFTHLVWRDNVARFFFFNLVIGVAMCRAAQTFMPYSNHKVLHALHIFSNHCGNFCLLQKQMERSPLQRNNDSICQATRALVHHRSPRSQWPRKILNLRICLQIQG